MKKTANIVSAGLLALCLSQTAMVQASGLKVNIVSTSAMGTANAGRGALLEDASVVYYNPSAMAMFKQPQFSGGLFYANLDAKLSNIKATDANGDAIVPGVGDFDDGGDFMPEGLGPFLYYMHPVFDDISVGLGLFPAFSTESRYSNKAVLGEFATATKLQVVDIQPAVAIKLSESFSLGVGVDFLLAEGELSQQAQAKAGDGFKARVSVTGKGNTVAYNLSAFWTPTSSTSIGLLWRSATDVVLHGDGEFITRASDGKWELQGKEPGGKVPLSLPMSFDFSLDQKLTNHLSAQLGVLWMQWSVFERLDVIGQPGGGIISSKSNLGAQALQEGLIARVPTEWLDTFTVSLGTTYQMSESFKLRSGFMFDQDTGNKGEPAIARVPGNDQYWLTAGMGYAFGDSLSMDLAGAYILPVKTEIYETDNDLEGKPKTQSSISANSEINAFVLSAQLNYTF